MGVLSVFWKVLNYPRIRLASLPTPMEKTLRLWRELGLEGLYVKRDDVMELALGGNKVRKLEFILADALAKGCDVIVTKGSAFSNHVRLTAAAARKLGLDFYAAITPPGGRNIAGNILLDALMGAKLVYVERREDADEALTVLVDKLRAQGRKPYVIPLGGSCELGVLGYVLAALEIAQQAVQAGFRPDYVVHATGTGTTQAGLLLGFKMLGMDSVRVIGISDGTKKEVLVEKTVNLFNSTARMLGAEISVKPEDIVVYDEYGFGGYGSISKEVVEVIKRVARSEGLLLDPVYTGKAMYGVIDLASKGVIRGNVIFIHTGGSPIIFQSSGEVAKYTENPWIEI